MFENAIKMKIIKFTVLCESVLRNHVNPQSGLALGLWVRLQLWDGSSRSRNAGFERKVHNL